jgi:hypothetical protein
MTEQQTEQSAPELGAPTDAEPAGAPTSSAGDHADEQTIETPDELGGTGADEGGAGCGRSAEMARAGGFPPARSSSSTAR